MVLLNIDWWTPLRHFDLKCLVWASKCAFLTSSQVMLVKLLRVPHFGKHTVDGENEVDE